MCAGCLGAGWVEALPSRPADAPESKMLLGAPYPPPSGVASKWAGPWACQRGIAGTSEALAGLRRREAREVCRGPFLPGKRGPRLGPPWPAACTPPAQRSTSRPSAIPGAGTRPRRAAKVRHLPTPAHLKRGLSGWFALRRNKASGFGHCGPVMAVMAAIDPSKRKPSDSAGLRPCGRRRFRKVR